MRLRSNTRVVVRTTVELDENETSAFVSEVQTLIAEGKLADDSSLWVIYNSIRTREERHLKGMLEPGDGEWYPDAEGRGAT